MQEFRPPIDNAPFMAFCKWGLPLELFRAQISVSVVGDGLARFADLQGKPAVVICNHSEQYDPEVMFTFSKMMGEDFYFIAAREVFNWFLGTCGLFFQNLGVYSVARGQADQQSYQMTRQVIAYGLRKLVVFPEGEVTWQPDTLLPFKRGATKLFLDSQEMLLSKLDAEPLLIQPIAVRWRYNGDISARLHAAMAKVERQLQIAPASASLSNRIFGAAAAMLTALEIEYRAPVHEELPFEQRVTCLRDHVLRRIGQFLNVELPPQEIHRDWLRRISGVMDDYLFHCDSAVSSFQRRLHCAQARKMLALVKDMHRIQHFVGVNPGAPNRQLTQERLANIVDKIELEVLGRISAKGHREARLAVGQAISLLPFRELYRQDATTAVEAATQLMERNLQKLVDELDDTPAFLLAAS